MKKDYHKHFLTFVNKTKDCWIYKGFKHPNGYGVFWLNGKGHQAHRASWILHKGSIPNGMWILHKCDTRSCVKPSHLWVGTPSDNSRDMIKKGRQNGPKGERAPKHKLTELNVKEIRNTYVLRKITCKMLGKKFGVRAETIGDIIERKTWKHI